MFFHVVKLGCQLMMELPIKLINMLNKDDLQKNVKQIGTTKLIVDDGSHNPKHQFDSFIYLFENLFEDGIYILGILKLVIGIQILFSMVIESVILI